MKLGLVVAAAGLVLTAAGCGRRGEDPARIREYANTLAANELYAQAVAEYGRYLDTARLGDAERANVAFVMAGLYFERLHDYENALAAYLRIKTTAPGTDLMPQVDKQIVACLERLGRSGEAKQVLDEATALNPAKPAAAGAAGSTVLAKIGDRTVTDADLTAALDRMPESLRGRFESKAGRVEFLRQFVANELICGAAERAGLDRDADVQEAAYQAKRGAMARKYLEREIGPQVRLSGGDLQTYYRANREKYAELDAKGKVKRQRPYEEVREQVQADAAAEKEQQAVQAMIGRMMTAEGVQIYDDKVR
jgi:hypothetical protein